MQLSGFRPRFTVRRMMVAVAITGVLIGGWAEGDRRRERFNWAAPRKLVHLKWKSLGKLEPGGTHEQETDRRRSDSIAERRRSRPGQGTDRLRLLPQGRCRPDHLPSLAQAA